MLRVSSLLLIALITVAPISAYAVKILDADLSDPMVARISDHDPNRIRISDGYIATAVGPRNGRIAIETNDKQGELFIRINAKDPEKDKAFTLFLTDAHGRDYNLLLKPRNIAGKSIVIIASHTKKVADKVSTRPVGISIRTRRIKRLIRAMASGEAPRRCTISVKNRRLPLWKGTVFQLLRTAACGDFNVDSYRLTNTGGAEIRLAEQELYRDGVAAVAVEKLHLNKSGVVSLARGVSTKIIIVRAAP